MNANTTSYQPLRLKRPVSAFPLIKGLRVTGWGLTDAILNCDCRKCGAPAGYRCRTPSGRRSTTHPERYHALVAKGYNAGMRAFGCAEAPDAASLRRT